MQLDIPDLKLLHFWTMSTAPTISVPAHGDIWQTKMVEVGFKHHFVLHGILAVAAIHRGELHCLYLSLHQVPWPMTFTS